MPCSNAASPLLLPWTNVTVTSDNRAISRGIEFVIGTPPQVLSLRPALGNNDTFVFNAADCVTSTNDTCIGTKGGVYDSSKSSTFSLSAESIWNGTHGRELKDGSYIYFNDDVRLTSSAVAYGFPVFMDQYGQGSQSGLGLGPSSVFLNATVQAGVAPTTSWGLWTGSRSVANPVDGLLVVGGYDSARVEGEFTEFQSFQNCYACTQIVKMVYNGPGGSTSMFSNDSQVLQIGLEPFQRSLYVPQNVYDNFMNATGGYYDTTQQAITYPTGSPPVGNLTVTLQNGYQTTIPADELFTPPRLYNSQGEYSISNNSVVISRIANGSDPNYVAEWGIPFLTMNYFVIDYQAGKFRLAPAIRQDFGSAGGALIQPLCTGVAPTASPTLPPTPPASKGTMPVGPVSHHSNTGAIAGGVVGGVLGLAIIGFLIFFLTRKRKRTRGVESQAHHPEAGARPPTADMSSHEAKEAPRVLVAPRSSTYDGTSTTDYTELESPEEKQHSMIGQWVSHQQSQTHDTDEPKLSPNVNEPFEMPVEIHKH